MVSMLRFRQLGRGRDNSDQGKRQSNGDGLPTARGHEHAIQKRNIITERADGMRRGEGDEHII